jgi:hypothetical protein
MRVRPDPDETGGRRFPASLAFNGQRRTDLRRHFCRHSQLLIPSQSVPIQGIGFEMSLKRDGVNDEVGAMTGPHRLFSKQLDRAMSHSAVTFTNNFGSVSRLESSVTGTVSTPPPLGVGEPWVERSEAQSAKSVECHTL